MTEGSYISIDLQCGKRRTRHRGDGAGMLVALKVLHLQIKSRRFWERYREVLFDKNWI